MSKCMHYMHILQSFSSKFLRCTCRLSAVCVMKQCPGSFNLVAPDCGSWSLVSRGTSLRSPMNPNGRSALPFVARGNTTVARWEPRFLTNCFAVIVPIYLQKESWKVMGLVLFHFGEPWQGDPSLAVDGGLPFNLCDRAATWIGIGDFPEPSIWMAMQPCVVCLFAGISKLHLLLLWGEAPKV